MTTKKYGMSAKIEGFFKKDTVYTKEEEGVCLKIKDGIIELTYDSKEYEVAAQAMARAYFDAYIVRTGYKIKASFNHTWEVKDNGGKDYKLYISDVVPLTENISISLFTHQRTITGTSTIITKESYDSASLEQDTEMASRIRSNHTLQRAMHYYAHEVVGAERPMAGIYNAIEVITNSLGGSTKGRAALAEIAGKSFRYVDNLMQATQPTRHPDPNTKIELSIEEASERAKILITAFANSLS
ncbi:MAG TPA: hypothetical protein VFT87_05275 [Candidatus Saccharimonadales bacterium]|nr:hypothetical protein [Candidatus Saccharimonadales bacterium]